MKKLMVSCLITALAASTSWLSAATLKVGDPAPKLQTGKWVQGEPVKEFAANKAYLVEFWATWCGPCRQTIPHLNELWQKYKAKDLIIIGQDVWERDEAEVTPFVKKMGDKMTYRVALDDKSKDKKGAMATTWMEAADQNGIPTAFLVDKKGRIAWIGHPLSLKTQTIDEVLAGTYDVQKASAEAAKDREQEEKLSALGKKLGEAIQGKHWDEAEKVLDELTRAIPEPHQRGLEPARLQVLLGKGDAPQAAQLIDKLGEEYKDNAQVQNQIAWMVATHEGAKKEAVAAAIKAAERANELSGRKESAILDTLARLQFLLGKATEAVSTQEAAIEVAQDESLKKELRKVLESYKAGKLPATTRD